MRSRKSLRAIAIIVAFAGVLLAQVYGCGNSTDRYVEKVLQRWLVIEERSELLVEGLAGLTQEGGAERFWLQAGDVRQAADSFRRDLDRKLLVPEYQEKYNNLLVSFLSGFSSYMKGLQDYLDMAVGGEEEGLPDIEDLAARARQSLGDYQDAQEYNGAALDENVWGLAEALRMFAGPGPDEAGTAATVTDEAALPSPEEAMADWYGLFNQGDGERMYYMLSPYSPLLEEYGVEQFIARVGEANYSGLRARCETYDVESVKEDGLDWAVAHVVVEYDSPAGREEFYVELDYVDGLWMITRVNSPSGIW